MALVSAGCSDSASAPALNQVGSDGGGPPNVNGGDAGGSDPGAAPDEGQPDEGQPDEGPGDEGPADEGGGDAEPPPDCESAADCEGLVEVGACETAVCSPEGQCLVGPLADGTECDDGDPCTGEDICVGGSCKGAEDLCACEGDGDCAGFDDEDLCNGVWICAEGSCQVDPATVVECEAPDDPCVVASCDPGTGACGEAPALEGAPCDDGDVCTTVDTCQGGECEGDVPLACEAGTCETVTCDPSEGCVVDAADNGSPCDDGNPCTTEDQCLDGACGGNAAACACETDADCAPYQVNLCLPALVCDEGSCVAGEGPGVVCDAPDSTCLTAACEPATGECVETPAVDGLACETGSPCAPLGACLDGACLQDEDPCDDGNPCTDDVCDPIKGCGNLPVEGGTPCDDGNPCTEGEACGPQGACGGGDNVCGCSEDSDCAGADFDQCLGEWSCQEGACVVDTESATECGGLAGPCVSASCDPASGACVTELAEDGSVCDDGSVCTQDTICVDGSCGGGGALDCDDANPCTNESCDPQLGCVYSPAEGPCDDGNACTLGDACQDGVCVAASALICEAEGACVEATCDPEVGCLEQPLEDGSTCDDGDSCTEPDTCEGGACVGTPVCECVTAADCPDDGDLCNGVPVCNGGICEIDAATVVSCQGGTTCAPETCDPATGACQASPVEDGTPCEAGACVQDEACIGGSCLGDPVVCDDDNPCTADFCDEDAGICVYTATEDAPCDDGDPCSAESRCNADGDCEATLPEDCDDGDACTIDVCDSSTGCVSTSGAPCSDDDPCTNDACDPVAGCVFTAKVCPPEGPCTVGFCSPESGACGVEPVGPGEPCDDGDPCTAQDTCTGGACAGSPVDCSDDDPCTIDSCDATGACTYEVAPGCVDDQCDNVAAGAACDDGDGSTFADICLAGVCRGFTQTIPGATTLDAETILDKVHVGGDHWYATADLDYGGGGAGALVDVTNPAAAFPAPGTIQGTLFRDIYDGFAVDADGELWRLVGGTWTTDHDLAKALDDSGLGNPYGLFVYEGLLSGTNVWVVGGNGNNYYIRRCQETQLGLNLPICVSQDLESPSRPRAVGGYSECIGPVCNPQMVIGADFNAGMGQYFNDTFQGDGLGDFWEAGFIDPGADVTQTRNVTALGDGRFVVSGTSGYFRHRTSGGSWTYPQNLVPSQASFNLMSAWAGAGAMVMISWANGGGGSRELDVWTCDLGDDCASGSSWTLHGLPDAQGSGAGIFDVWGDDKGRIVIVGGTRGNDNLMDALIFSRNP